MKRARIELENIACFDNLAEAAIRAAKGKRNRPVVRRFFADFENNLEKLAWALVGGEAPKNQFKQFTILDPKRRVIHAPCFEDRVVHHAVMKHLSPLLDRALVDSTYACRSGMGNLAAAQAVQSASRRFPWYVKVDIKAYFDSVDHVILTRLLQHKFKGNGIHRLIAKILSGYETFPGHGLPIGALTSQHFANYYLDGLDRFLTEKLKACAHVRYMDDTIWWCSSKSEALDQVKAVISWVAAERNLTVKDFFQINRSTHGVTFCGFRIRPGTMRLTRRRRKRYQQARAYWEGLYQSGLIDEHTLQRSYDAVFAITAHAHSRSWRREALARQPPPRV